MRGSDRDPYSHCKTILVLGGASALMEKAGIPPALPSGKADPGIIVEPAAAGDATVTRFTAALAAHRHFMRETDPPRV